MSEQPVSSSAANIPRWDIADRMRKSLRTSGVGVQEMADYLQVARNTVSTWINGRIEPTPATVRLWALRTGVPFTWLCHGDMQPCDLRPRGVPAGETAGPGNPGAYSTKMHKLQTGEVA